MRKTVRLLRLSEWRSPCDRGLSYPRVRQSATPEERRERWRRHAAHRRSSPRQYLRAAADDVLDKVLNIINLVRGDDDRGAFVYVETEQGVPERAPHHSIHTQLDLIQEQDWAVACQGEDRVEC